MCAPVPRPARRVAFFEFLATLSHELRNPLNAILGWANVLTRHTELPENVKHGLRAIERNSKAQAQMIADLLDYAGITFGKMRIETRFFDFFSAVRTLIGPSKPPS